MTTVCKYPIPLRQEEFSIDLPMGAEILHFDYQNGKLYIWCRVSDAAEFELRRFRFAGTGHALSDEVGNYIGTVLEGIYVWHLFEMKS